MPPIAGMILGIAMLITFVVSIGAIVQANHVTMGLVILNYFLLVDTIMTVVIGAFVWFFTLRERDNFHKRWIDLTSADRVTLQDKVRHACCLQPDNHSLWDLVFVLRLFQCLRYR